MLFLIAVVLIVKIFTNNDNDANTKPYDVPAQVYHRVLFISSYTPQYFTYNAQVAGLTKGLYPNGIEYDAVYMDAKNYSSEEDIQNFHDFLKSRLTNKDRKYEAILLGDDNALLFAMQYQKELFNELPMVFFGVNDISLAKKACENPYITGFYENNYLDATLEIATRIFPDRKTYVALHDATAAGAADMTMFENYGKSHPELTLYDINASELSQSELTKELLALPNDALLIYMTCYSDKDGNTYSMENRTNTVIKYTKVPILRNYVGAEGMGVIGGVAMDFEDQCYMAGSEICDIIEGKNISNYHLNEYTKSRTSFDYSLLQQYGIDTTLLPDDAIYYNRPETFIDKYGSILIPISLILLALLFYIITINISVRINRLINDELLLTNDNLTKSREALKYQAEHDDFLGLINRVTINDILRNNTQHNSIYSLVMADLDGFKGINESYGHIMADQLLKKISGALKEKADANGWTLARYEGDQFLIIVPNENLTTNHPVTREILNFFRKPIELGDEIISISASIGISNSDGYTTPDQNIVNAEFAMYEAKRNGRDGVFIFEDDLKKKAKEESEIKLKLLNAFENDGFYMLYQPQINTQTKEISGYEALVRMKEPGMYPGKFIPVAEKNGWIWRIGRITTELVIRQLAEWKNNGYELHPISVNFSSNQMNDEGYVDFIKELLAQYDIPAKYLEIEITEGLFLEHTSRADDLFKQFKDMGITLLMDDFGTGYSSLGYLTYIPVDIIKLDKSLVDTYLVDGKDSFINHVIELVHDLNRKMIIEGVEEEWQYERLKAFGADTIQGYYFSKPIPADEAITFKVSQ